MQRPEQRCSQRGYECGGAAARIKPSCSDLHRGLLDLRQRSFTVTAGRCGGPGRRGPRAHRSLCPRCVLLAAKPTACGSWGYEHRARRPGQTNRARGQCQPGPPWRGPPWRHQTCKTKGPTARGPARLRRRRMAPCAVSRWARICRARGPCAVSRWHAVVPSPRARCAAVPRLRGHFGPMGRRLHAAGFTGGILGDCLQARERRRRPHHCFFARLPRVVAALSLLACCCHRLMTQAVTAAAGPLAVAVTAWARSC